MHCSVSLDENVSNFYLYIFKLFFRVYIHEVPKVIHSYSVLLWKKIIETQYDKNLFYIISFNFNILYQKKNCLLIYLLSFDQTHMCAEVNNKVCSLSWYYFVYNEWEWWKTLVFFSF